MVISRSDYRAKANSIFLIIHRISSKIQFRYEILFIFIVFEVLLFDSDSSVQIIVTYVEYIFIAFALYFNMEIGVMYFISFSVLALGLENYVSVNTIPNTFWGFRMFGFSFNILFSIFMAIYCIYKNKYIIILRKIDINNWFFIYFISYSFIIGTLGIILSRNHFDNYLQDTLTYLPYFIYFYLISLLQKESIYKIIQYSFSLTIIIMLLSYGTHKMFQYGANNYFVLVNRFSFILPVAIFLFNEIFPKWIYYILFLIVIGFLISGNIFIGGKTIIMFIFTFIWVIYSFRKYSIPLLVIFLVMCLFVEAFFIIMIKYYAGSVIAFKFAQIYVIFKDINIYNLATIKSSMGSIIAEGITVLNYVINNKVVLFFGKGFGGGIPDLYGYLAPWAGASGYAFHDLARNDYFKMHLPIYEVIIKAGILGWSFFLFILIKNFVLRNKYAFISFLLFFMVFYVSKEYLLLTILFLKLAETNSKPYIIKLNDRKLILTS